MLATLALHISRFRYTGIDEQGLRMSKATLSLPAQVNYSSLFHFARELDYYCQHDRVIVNMPIGMSFTPFGMLFLATKLRCFREKTKCEVIFNGWNNYDYLSHMGFFDLCGFRHGKEMGAAWGGINYLPITEVTRESFYEKGWCRRCARLW